MIFLKQLASLFSTKTPEKAYTKISPPLVSYDAQPESTVIDMGGRVLHSYNFERDFDNIQKLIDMYRKFATMPEVDDAIDEIVNAAVVYGDNDPVISLDFLEKNKLKENTQKIITEAFEHICNILKVEEKLDKDFREWYVIGRVHYHLKIPDKNSKKFGIFEINRLDSKKVIRVKENDTSEFKYLIKVFRNPHGMGKIYEEETYLVPKEHISFIPSGILDFNRRYYISYLDRAVKVGNQLNILEDSAVVYRFTRAPERRVFYVDVGRMPPKRAEEYVKQLMNKFKSKTVYDTGTGKITQNKSIMTMLEDFWLPRLEGSRGTEVSTLPGGQQLGEIGDIQYFKKKLYKALKIPLSRADIDNQPTIDFGRSTEFQREEIKFKKHINRLRSEYANGILEILKTHLVYTNKINKEEWKEKVRPFLKIRWNEDIHLIETREQEHLRTKIELVKEADALIGKYLTRNEIQSKIMKRTDEEIKQFYKDVEEEKKQFPEQTDSGGRGF